MYTVNDKKKNQSTYIQWLRIGKLRRARPWGWASGGWLPPARVSGCPGLGPAAGRSCFPEPSQSTCC